MKSGVTLCGLLVVALILQPCASFFGRATSSPEPAKQNGMTKPATPGLGLKYSEFKNTYHKVYTAPEDVYRKSVFKRTSEEVQEYNQQEGHTYVKGLNRLSDLTKQEFIQNVLIDFSKIIRTDDPKPLPPCAGQTLPVSISWKGQDSPVKFQGICGSCWAFSSLNQIEAMYRIKTNKSLDLSEQHLAECCTGLNCFGCLGASPEAGFRFVGMYGAVTEDLYPYIQTKSQTLGKCKIKEGSLKLLNKTRPFISTTGERSIKQFLAKGPVSTLVDASNWLNYKTGIYSPDECTLDVNHGVLLVGYEEGGVWIVKNSWGGEWGESGYIRLASGNTCGLLNTGIIGNLI